MKIFLTLCILSITHWSEQRSTPQDETYVAAVVEYQVERNLENNLNRYVSLIQQAAAQDADIVVFPEMTLTSGHSVPVPIYGLLNQYPIPALQPSLYDEVLVRLSTAARVNEIYVVVNIEELMNCTTILEGENCETATEYFFNTNVVFDRNGTVIDRYRKINLFGEYTRTPALTPDLGVFGTDFGVTFGHFICFDLMFQVPAVQIVQKLNITDIVFTTMWFSEMPYLTAVQIQEAYTYMENVNFLAAGANNVAIGSAGSGIYSGKVGALISVMPGTNTTRLLVSRVPKVPGRVTWTFPGPEYDPPNVHDNLYLLRDPSISAHVTRILVPGHQEFELSHNEVTCLFRINMTPRNGAREYVYRAAAFDGVRTFGGHASGGARACAIYACVDENVATCATRFDNYVANSTPTFEELFIRCQAPSPSFNLTTESMDSSYFPVSMDVSTMPLPVQEYEVQFPAVPTAVGVYTLRLLNTKAELLSFGIWGRSYDKDGQTPTNTSIVFKSSWSILLLLLLIVMFY